MARYRRRPAEVDAIQWTGDNLIGVINWTGKACTVQPDGTLMVQTGLGTLWPRKGDYLIRTGDAVGLKVERRGPFELDYEPAGG